MSNDNLLLYILKRGPEVGYVSNFEQAVPLNDNAPSPPRLLCSKKIIKRIEIIFPIRLTEPIPVMRVWMKDEMTKTKTNIDTIRFTTDFSNASRAIFYADTDIQLGEGIYLEFSISRDCAIGISAQNGD